MTRGLVLVDSSLLIEALRIGGDPAAVERVRQLLVADRLAVWEAVIAEMLVGARGEPDYRRLRSRLASRRILPCPPDVGGRAGRLGFELRRQGYSVPLVDLATAVVATHHGVELLHRDRHFQTIAEFCDLRQEYVEPGGITG